MRSGNCSGPLEFGKFMKFELELNHRSCCFIFYQSSPALTGKWNFFCLYWDICYQTFLFLYLTWKLKLFIVFLKHKWLTMKCIILATSKSRIFIKNREGLTVHPILFWIFFLSLDFLFLVTWENKIGFCFWLIANNFHFFNVEKP